MVRRACLSHQCGWKRLRWLPKPYHVRSYASCRACWIVLQPHRAFGDAYGDPDFFAPFFLACSPSFCHRLPIIATQHLIYNAPQRMCTIEYIWHDIQGQFVALLLCKYSQKSSHSLVALPSSASTPAIVLTRRASKCKKWHCYTLIMIYRSVLIIWTTGMMRTEARIIVCMQKWCFRKVKAGCSPATKYLLL